MAQFLQYKAADQRVASSRLTGVAVLCSLARHFIPFLVLVKYRKTENRPQMTEKTLSEPLSVYTYKLNTRCISWLCITFVYQSLRRYTVLALDRSKLFCNLSLTPIFAYRVHVSIRCCYTFPFTYTYSYAANPDNSDTKHGFTSNN